ncbi:MAG: class I SAM-dependent methyltransferase [Candidatus Limnocylindria bacterium]
MRARQEGTAPDGSPLELYRLLPPGREPDLIASAIPPPARLLELGSGPGRVTHALLERGYEVVAVDESAEMLAHVRGARTVRSRIEDLDLGELFDGVLLMSHLVNQPERAARSALLSACRRHLRPGGRVLVERLDPRLAEREPGETVMGDVRIRLADARREADRLYGTVEYDAGERGRFTHSFAAFILDDATFAEDLADAGLMLAGWLDERRTVAVAERA